MRYYIIRDDSGCLCGCFCSAYELEIQTEPDSLWVKAGFPLISVWAWIKKNFPFGPFTDGKDILQVSVFFFRTCSEYTLSCVFPGQPTTSAWRSLMMKISLKSQMTVGLDSTMILTHMRRWDSFVFSFFNSVFYFLWRHLRICFICCASWHRNNSSDCHTWLE